jgi:NhaP-type Na+/H+ or K+/H+ antiporter
MDEYLVLKVALIGVLGVGAQWAAWRFNLPAIVLMSAAGLMAGPVFGVLDPSQDFGDLLRPMISIAVAIILFEGGLTLNFREIEDVGKAVRRLVFPGVLFSWAGGALAAHYIAGLEWPIALLFAGILVVTGPTVIIPLLRQAKLQQRSAAVLKWEGIINDPIGAVLAVFVFQFIVASAAGEGLIAAFARLTAASAIAMLIGWAAAQAIGAAFRRGVIPEYLKSPFILCTVLAVFSFSNLLGKETGLITVTAMGVILGNMRLASLSEMRRFKESITILLVSGVFVVLTATLTPQMVSDLGWRAALFVAAIMFIVRPAAVWLSTIGSELTVKERVLVGWIAPRGIVLAAVSGLFAVELGHAGIEGAELLTPLAFAIIFATVIAHGFSIGPFGRFLGLSLTENPGVLIVGASAWSTELAKLLKKLDVPVTLADTDWRSLKQARLADVETYYGEILSEVTEHHLDLNRYGYLLAVSGNQAYNSLVCTDLSPELGRATSFQLSGNMRDEKEARAYSVTVRGRTLTKAGVTLGDLLQRHYGGWEFKKTGLTDEFTVEDYLASLDGTAEPFLIKRKNGVLKFIGKEDEFTAEAGDVVVAYTPPEGAPAQKKTPAPVM